jgi:very-short-patch-repair endonuclease
VGQLVAVVDLGWRDAKVGVDYGGKHHRMTRSQFARDIRRHAEVTELGWDDVRRTDED